MKETTNNFIIQAKLAQSDPSFVSFCVSDDLVINNIISYGHLEWYFMGDASRDKFTLPLRIDYPKDDLHSPIFSFSTKDFLDKLDTFPYRNRWRLYLRCTEDQKVCYIISNSKEAKRLESKPTYNRSSLFGKPIGNFSYQNENFLVRPCFTPSGKAIIELPSYSERFRGLYETQIIDFSLQKSIMHLSFRAFKINGYRPHTLTMTLRNSDNQEQTTYHFPITVISSSEKFHILKCSFDLTTLSLRPLFWDLTLDYIADDQTIIHTSIKNRHKKFSKKYFENFFRDDSYDLGSNIIFYPHLSIYHIFGFMCRERNQTDTFVFRIKERLAAFYYRLNKKRFINKQIHLVYEKFSSMAQDNGYYYFKYCMDHDLEKTMGRSIYYVIDKNSPDRAKLEPYKDHVLNFMSVKHIAYFLSSRLLISSDTKTHSYAWRNRNSMIYPYLRNKKIVFLQHGVTALKRMEYLFGKGKNGGCNLFITTSNFEKDIVKDYFGYDEADVSVTGFSRWDVLKDTSDGKREILLMPTWRNWLEEVPSSIFKESSYYKEYFELLSSNSLHALLEAYDLTLNFYIHPKFKDYITDFSIENPRIHLIPFGSQPLNKLMMSCKLLITDYSSVCWDVYYQKKPVIFYQFDLDDYMKHHGSYLDMKTELFGPRAEDSSTLLKQLQIYCDNDFTLDQDALAHYQDYFMYTDNNNSARIAKAIIEKGW